MSFKEIIHKLFDTIFFFFLMTEIYHDDSFIYIKLNFKDKTCK